VPTLILLLLHLLHASTAFFRVVPRTVLWAAWSAIIHKMRNEQHAHCRCGHGEVAGL
jgi:hypothetical protein